MKRNTLSGLILLAIVIMMGACGEGNAYDELPSPIARFVSEYFPFGEVASYTVEEDGVSRVLIRNGAELTFDADCDWTAIDGRGQTLPTQLLYDDLPPTLYDYIESIEQVGGVYRLSRNDKQIDVEFHDTSLVYDYATHTISYPSKI